MKVTGPQIISTLRKEIAPTLGNPWESLHFGNQLERSLRQTSLNASVEDEKIHELGDIQVLIRLERSKLLLQRWARVEHLSTSYRREKSVNFQFSIFVNVRFHIQVIDDSSIPEAQSIPSKFF